MNKNIKPLYDPLHLATQDDAVTHVWILDEGGKYIFETVTEDDDGRFIKDPGLRVEFGRRMVALWNSHLAMPTSVIEKRMGMDNVQTHTHIDSSGIFECPLGSACDLPDAGKIFDELLCALRSAYSALQGKDTAMRQQVREVVKSVLDLVETQRQCRQPERKRVVIVMHDDQITSVFGDNIEYTVRKFSELEDPPGPIEEADFEAAVPLAKYDDDAEQTVII